MSKKSKKNDWVKIDSKFTANCRECGHDAAIGPILGRFTKDIDTQKENLVDCEKKDFDKLQARIWACRQLACTLKGAYQDEIEEKVRRRAEFEKHNALFLMAETSERKGKKKNEVAEAQSAAS